MYFGIVSACAVAIGVVLLTAENPTEGTADSTVVSSGNAADICLPLNAENRAALLSKAKFLELRIRSYQPPANGTADIKVSLSGGEKPVDLTVIGLFPSVPFKATDEKDYRRFHVPLTLATDSLVGAEKLCLKVLLAPSDQGAEGASAEVDAKISSMP